MNPPKCNIENEHGGELNSGERKESEADGLKHAVSGPQVNRDMAENPRDRPERQKPGSCAKTSLLHRWLPKSNGEDQECQRKPGERLVHASPYSKWRLSSKRSGELPGKKALLEFLSVRVPGERTIGTDYAMAGNDQRDWIGSVRTADRSCGSLDSNAFSELRVADGSSVRDAVQLGPDTLLERTPVRVQV